MNSNKVEYVIASPADPFTIWNFCTPETAAVAIESAEKNALESMERASRLAIEIPSMREYWQQQAAKHRATIGTYAIMTFEEHQAKERAYILSLPLHEITEERFHEMLNVLPPLKWCRQGCVEMFCMSEFFTDTYTDQYAHDHATGKYYTKLVDYSDQSTWIHEVLKAQRT